MTKEEEKKAVHSAIDSGEIPTPEEIFKVKSYWSKLTHAKMTPEERSARAKKAGSSPKKKRKVIKK